MMYVPEEEIFWFGESLFIPKEVDIQVKRKGGRTRWYNNYFSRNKDDGRDHTKQVEKHNLKLYSAEEMKTLLKKSGFSNISFTYFKSIWIPFKGYIVSKGLIVKAIKSV